MKPSWLKVQLPSGAEYRRIKEITSRLQLATVCEEARCPNIAECWGGGTATIMLMGDTCTRGCRFCHVKTGRPKTAPDSKEPGRATMAVSKMGLSYVVLTSVNRDDLPDGGASHFAQTVEMLRQKNSHLFVEVLTPDFRGNKSCVRQILKSKPHVFAHNIETVERLTPQVRDRRASYAQSLSVLRQIKEESSQIFTKSSIMLGLGETPQEVRQTLQDLRRNACDVVTFGQYLQPSRRHLPVKEYVHPSQFEEWKKTALDMGFLYCAGGPLVRSSYRAGEYFIKGVLEKGVQKPDTLV